MLKLWARTFVEPVGLKGKKKDSTGPDRQLYIQVFWVV